MKRVHVEHPRRYFTFCVNMVMSYIHKSDPRPVDQSITESGLLVLRSFGYGNLCSITNPKLREQNRAWLAWLEAEQVPHHYEATHHYQAPDDDLSLHPEWENRMSVCNALVHLYDRDHAFETRLRFDIMRVSRGMKPIAITEAFSKKWDH